jgi:hypothetical protein
MVLIQFSAAVFHCTEALLGRFSRADHNPQNSIQQVLLDDIRLIGTGGERVLYELTYPAPHLQAIKIRVDFKRIQIMDNNLPRPPIMLTLNSAEPGW